MIERAASEAGWRLPRTLAALAIAGGDPEAAAARLPSESIHETIGDLTCVIVPDPDGPRRRAEIERAVLDAGINAALGTTVTRSEAALSFARARAALTLADHSPSLIVARERAGELLLASDPRLAAELASDRLAPLAELPAGARARLTETLRAWLAEQGRLSAVAQRLGVHPQTVRYRLTRLRELFGDALEDPDARFALELALRIRAQPGA
jgi:sugar diacid utilization regulator